MTATTHTHNQIRVRKMMISEGTMSTTVPQTTTGWKICRSNQYRNHFPGFCHFSFRFQTLLSQVLFKLLLPMIFLITIRRGKKTLFSSSSSSMYKTNVLTVIAVIQLPTLLYGATPNAMSLTPFSSSNVSGALQQHQDIEHAIHVRNDSIRRIREALHFKINDYVSDDNQHYEQVINAESTDTDENCPAVCKCLDSFFDCGNKDLTYVPRIPDYVLQLDLKHNYLNDTSVLQLKNMPKMIRLILRRNQLETMPIFLGLNSLKHLNLAHNRIKRITNESLVALPKLKTLDLSRNQLHALESNYFSHTNCIAHLFLNDNKIININEHVFETLNDLVNLDLDRNRLTTLPIGIFKKLSKLRKLSLNYNSLEVSWSTFKGLDMLQKLYLKGNNIRHLQSGVFHVMRVIESIHLDYNNITTLSRQGLINLTKLQHLTLSHNAITRIETDTWEFTQSLVTLDLSSNKIKDFQSQHLECLHHLKYLNLADNNIRYLPENTFDCVRNLEELILHSNDLSWNIEDLNSTPIFKALRKLRILDLMDNNLKQLNGKSLNGLTNLQVLYLNDNPLASINFDALNHIVQLKELSINSMNVICDCQIREFHQWLSQNPDKFKGNIICNYPPQFHNHSLLSMATKQLDCVSNPRPVIQSESTNKLAVKGANVTFECIANTESNDSLVIKWRQDNELIMPSEDTRITFETVLQHNSITNKTIVISYLHWNNLDYTGAGRFQCVISNEYGTAYSQRFKLLIGIHPTFVKTPSNVTVDTGDTIRLVCSATGDPLPEMSLQKFGGSDFPAATERRLQVIREENAFLIMNAKLVDTGIYTCTAESPAGEIRINASVVVNDKPLNEIPHVRLETVQGESSVLKCLSEFMLDLAKTTNREWYKDNKPFHIASISLSDRYYFTTEKELLVIVNTQPSDAGLYRCEITDNLKTIAVETELIVVKDNFSSLVIIVSIIVVTILCVLLGSLIVWFVLLMQRRKLPQNCSVTGGGARVAVAPHHNAMQATTIGSGGSLGSSLDQTQLTSMNSTFIQPSQAMVYHQQRPNYQQQLQPTYNSRLMPPIPTQKRPHSLAELDFHRIGNHQLQQQQSPLHSLALHTNNRVIITQTPHDTEATHPLSNCNDDDGVEEEDVGFTLDFSHRQFMINDIENKQDQLSSKDSGTGSDTAVKRSLEDFNTGLLIGGDVKPHDNIVDPIPTIPSPIQSSTLYTHCETGAVGVLGNEGEKEEHIELYEIGECDFLLQNKDQHQNLNDIHSSAANGAGDVNQASTTLYS